MLYQSTQELVIPPTARLGAPVYLLIMERALQMTIQAIQAAKFSFAQVALEPTAIPSLLRSNALQTATAVARQFDHRPRDNVIAVQLADRLVDPIAVEARGAAPGF